MRRVRKGRMGCSFSAHRESHWLSWFDQHSASDPLEYATEKKVNDHDII